MRNDGGFYVYILAGNQPENGKITLYVGATSDLIRRVWEHRQGIGSRFTARYRVRRLMWYEEHASLEEAAVREFRIKKWRRSDKEKLITDMNPEWRDLYPSLL